MEFDIQEREVPFSVRSTQKLHFWQAMLGLLTVVSAGSAGMYVSLSMMNSKEGVYQAALIPLLFGIFFCMFFFTRRAGNGGALLILFAALFLPFSIGTGTQSVVVDSLVITIGLFGLWVIRVIFSREKEILARSPVNVPLIGLIVVNVLSLGWGIFARDPHVFVWEDFYLVQLASTAVYIFLPIAFLLAANEVQQDAVFKWMVALTLTAGILGLISELLSLPSIIETRGIMSMWFVLFSFSLAMFNRNLPMVVRMILTIHGAAWLYQTFGVNISWIAGWFPAFVGLAVLVYLRSWRALVIYAIIILLLIGPNQEFYLGNFLHAEAEESLFTRVDAFLVNWEITREHLLLGMGPAGYTVYYMTYYPNRAMATHNNYVDILSQNGILGLSLFLWFIASVLIVGIRVHQKFKNTGGFHESLANASLAGAVGSFVIMFFGDWMLPFAYTQTIAGFDYIVPTWLFIGTLVALDRIT